MFAINQCACTLVIEHNYNVGIHSNTGCEASLLHLRILLVANCLSSLKTVCLVMNFLHKNGMIIGNFGEHNRYVVRESEWAKVKGHIAGRAH